MDSVAAIPRRGGPLKRRRFLVVSAVAAAAAAPATAVPADHLLAPPAACPDQGGVGLPAVRERAALTCLVNWARTHAGLHPLRPSRRLTRSAQMKANEIARCGTLTHTPCGIRWDRVFDQVGYRGRIFENIAAGSGPYATPRAAVEMWLTSPAHRAAMLSGAASQMGVGMRFGALVSGFRGSVWTLHMGRPA